MNESVSATPIQFLGAAGFGAILGWYLYFINRYRRSDVKLADLATVIGVLGGGAIMAIFPARTDLFGAYGVGLFVGFFSYFLVLVRLVSVSRNFDADWFLDGRRRRPEEPYYVPDEIVTQRYPGMAMPEDPGPSIVNP